MLTFEQSEHYGLVTNLVSTSTNNKLTIVCPLIQHFQGQQVTYLDQVGKPFVQEIEGDDNLYVYDVPALSNKIEHLTLLDAVTYAIVPINSQLLTMYDGVV